MSPVEHHIDTKEIPRLTQAKKILVEKLGGPREVGRQLGISHATIIRWQWIPIHWVWPMAEKFEMHPSEIRPDLFPEWKHYPRKGSR